MKSDSDTEGSTEGDDAHSRPATRRRILQMGGGAALAALLGGCGANGSGGGDSGSAGGDSKILNYLLRLEQAQHSLYEAAISSGRFTGSHLELLRLFRRQEEQHIVHLTKTAKGQGEELRALPKPSLVVTDAHSALAQAQDLEELVAAAYLGQMKNVKGRPVLAAMLAIHSVEARHATALRKLRGVPAIPDEAFAKPATGSTVLGSIRKLEAA